jgi:hypothetical protein
MKNKIVITYTKRTKKIISETILPISTQIVIIDKDEFENLSIKNKHEILKELIIWVNIELDKLIK